MARVKKIAEATAPVILLPSSRKKRILKIMMNAINKGRYIFLKTLRSLTAATSRRMDLGITIK